MPTALSSTKRIAFREVRNEAFKIKGDLRKKLLDIRDELNDGAVEAGIMDRVVISSVTVDVRDNVQSAIDGIDVDGTGCPTPCASPCADAAPQLPTVLTSSKVT